VLCSLTRDSQNIPPLAIAEAAISSGRAPMRGTSWVDRLDMTMMTATIGR